MLFNEPWVLAWVMLFTEPQARTGTGLETESFGVLWRSLVFDSWFCVFILFKYDTCHIFRILSSFFP